MRYIYFALYYIGILIENASAQYAIGPTSVQISKQQLLSYLVNSNAAPLDERIIALATAVQQMPPKKNRRVYLADVLKRSALQNLMVAASVCGEVLSPIQEYTPRLPRYAPLPRRNRMVANVNDVLLFANGDLLSVLLPKELLSSLLAGDEPNRPMRIQ